MMSPSGSYAEYALASAKTTFHIPPLGISFEEAATIPLCAMTAARVQQRGIIAYGAARAVGAFAIKLLVHADIYPVLCVVRNGIPFVETRIDPAKSDKIIDYREGDDAIVKKLAAGVPAGQYLRLCL